MRLRLPLIALVVGACFALAPSAGADLPPAGIVVDPPTAAPGQPVTITGVLHLPVCQAPLGQIVVSLRGGPTLATLDRFDGLTRFRAEVVIPPDTPPGDARIETRCVLLPEPGIPLVLASTTFEVSPATDVPAPGADPPRDPADEPPLGAAPPTSPSVDGQPELSEAGADAIPDPGPATFDPPVVPPPPADREHEEPTPVETAASPVRETGGAEAGDEATGRSFTNLARFENLGLDAERAGAGALIVLVFALLVGFPATLFDATLRRNYDRITGRLDRAVPGLAAVRDRIASTPRLLPLGAFVAAAAVAGLFLEDGVGFNRHTAITFAALSIALAVTAYTGWLPAVVVAERKRVPGRFRNYPMALYLVAGGVLLSLTIEINPGYLYGLLLAYDVNGPWTSEDDGVTYGWGFALVLGVAVTGWLAWMPVHDAVLGGSTFALVEIADVALAVIVVAGIEGTILGLLPFPFTPGATVKRWSFRAWAGLYAVGFLAFTQILLRPDLGYTESQDIGELLRSSLAFLAFAGLSVWIWWYLNYRRPARDSPAADDRTPAPA